MFDILPEHLKLIKKILNNNLPPSTTIWIFGSRVKKAQKKYSDLDLLIDCNNNFLSDTTLINLKERFDESDLPYKVDIVDWHKISSEFKKSIKNKEILLKT